MLIRARSLRHRFPGQHDLFENLDFDVGQGEIVAITGPSGSGKSTLLGILAGWIMPTSGALERIGVARIRWVFQNPLGVAGRTAVDHVVLPILAGGARREDAERHALAVLARFDIADRAQRPFKDLSGGEAQRLALARAVASKPGLLLVDEPTAQLDPTSAASVSAVLHRSAEEGAIVFVATHDERVVGACDWALRLGKG